MCGVATKTVNVFRSLKGGDFFATECMSRDFRDRLMSRRPRSGPENGFCGMNVGVFFMSASDASEEGLAFAVPMADAVAFSAFSGSVDGVDLDDLSALGLDLVGEKGLELIPALLEDVAVETGFLADVSTRLVDRAFGRSCHVDDLEIFDADGSEPPGDGFCFFVVPLPADAGRLGFDRGGSLPGLGIAGGTALAPGHGLLMLAMAPVEETDLLERDRIEIAGGEGDGVGDAAVYADGLVSARSIFDLESTGEGDLPAESGSGNRYGSDVWSEGTAVLVASWFLVWQRPC